MSLCIVTNPYDSKSSKTPQSVLEGHCEVQNGISLKKEDYFSEFVVWDDLITSESNHITIIYRVAILRKLFAVLQNFHVKERLQLVREKHSLVRNGLDES